MPILRRPAPSGTYCSGCDSYICSHAAAGSSSTPPGLVVALQSLLAGLVVALLVPLAMLVSVATAHAADYGHISGGWPHPGRVVVATAEHEACGGGPRLRVRNNTSEPEAKQDAGPLGAGNVCVTPEAFAAHPVDTWFNNKAGTDGPVG